MPVDSIYTVDVNGLEYGIGDREARMSLESLQQSALSEADIDDILFGEGN